LDHLRNPFNPLGTRARDKYHHGWLDSHPARGSHRHDSRQLYLRQEGLGHHLAGILTEKLIMNKILSLAFLVGGVVLIIVGVNAMNSFSSDVSRFFTGSPTDKAVWMLIGGVVAASVGAAGTFRGAK
jgi:hypothetical protein